MQTLPSSPPSRQRGAILIISLVVLLVMTIIGVTAMQGTVLEEKMAGGLRDKSIAFQAAEAALRDAENALSAAVLPTFGSNGWHTWTGGSIWRTLDWSDDNLTADYSGPTLSNVAAVPRYIVEETLPVAGSGGSLEAGLTQSIDYYRITARGVGGSSNAVVMLQSYFKR